MAYRTVERGTSNLSRILFVCVCVVAVEDLSSVILRVRI